MHTIGKWLSEEKKIRKVESQVCQAFTGVPGSFPLTNGYDFFWANRVARGVCLPVFDFKPTEYTSARFWLLRFW